MPQTIAPVAAPVMPPSPSAHSQTTTADGDFAAIFQGRVSGKRAAAQENAFKQTAENSQENQDPSQTGIGAAAGAMGVAAVNNLQETFAGGQPATAFAAGLEQGIVGDGLADQTPDVPGLEELLPQLTASKNLNGRAAAPPPAAQRGGSILMGELRRLVESHDARASVNLDRGGKANLRDMPTLAVSESAPAATAAAAENAATPAGNTLAAAMMTPMPAAPRAKTLHSIAAPLSTASSENGQAASGKLVTDKREIAAAATANDKRRAAGQAQTTAQANKDQKAAERLPPAPASDRAAAASDDDSTSGQVAATAATSATVTDSAASVARPGQPPAAGVALMQQVIDHIRDLPRPLPNRISLQLHPAELGQLKINLTMQEGVIRASLVTQTVQAQEILEKHMPKLRALLERQGLELADVRIAQENNPITASAFFAEGRSSRRGEDSGGKGKKADGEHGDSGFARALAQADFDKQANGLNIHA